MVRYLISLSPGILGVCGYVEGRGWLAGCVSGGEEGLAGRWVGIRRGWGGRGERKACEEFGLAAAAAAAAAARPSFMPQVPDAYPINRGFHHSSAYPHIKRETVSFLVLALAYSYQDLTG